MNEFYYSAEPTSAHAEREIEIEALGVRSRCLTDAGVFSRDGLDTGTRAMLEALPELHGRVLDLGCGWGPVGMTLARKYPECEIVMTDVNHRAVELSRRNLARNGAKAEVVQGDGFESVTGMFDFILTNPPIRAGKAVIYRLFAEAKEHLTDDGALILVIRKQQGAASAQKYLQTLFPTVTLLDRTAGFHTLACLCTLTTADAQ